MRTALVILRTPFQAWMAKKVLAEERACSCVALYFTQENSEEDRHYYNEISLLSESSKYIYVPKTKWDILGQVRFKNAIRGWLHDLKLDITLFSSIDAFIPSAIMAKQKNSRLITFDDGTGNINCESVYFKEKLNLRGRFYRKCFGGLSLEETKKNIYRHYTLHPGFANIVDSSRIVPVPGWTDEQLSPRHGPIKRYFLGAPFFRRELKESIIHDLERYLASLGIHAYIRHPREIQPLNVGAPELQKNGLIAEEAILKDAGSAPIHVLGASSSVLFNMAFVAQCRTMLLFSSSFSSMESLALASGCNVKIFEATR